MSNIIANLQTQTSNALHNAIMEAGDKDRPPMLASGNYTEKTVPVAKGSSETTTKGYMEKYKNVLQDIRDHLNVEAEAFQIILIGIDNDIYSTVDACQNACEMWKAIERLKQVLTSITTGMAKKIYKPTNNVRTLLNTSRAHLDNTSRINKGTRYDNQRVVNVVGARKNVAYHKEKMLLCKQEEAGFQLNAEYTWTHFLRSKDETPKVLIDFLILVQRGLHAQLSDTVKRMELISKSHLHQLLDWKLSDYSLHGFVDLYHPEQVYCLKKALYGLKQALRAWYDELSNFLVTKGFSKGSIDPTLFITKHGEDIFLG
ncbi:retrovirus-related pol polyprotein from transposon TNT 1-94 [Tanacetum coccineum]